MLNSEIYINLLAEGKMEELYNYLSLGIPEYLGRFYSLSDDEEGKIETISNLNTSKLDTLKENANWFDYACNQNDPFELKMAYINEQFAKVKGCPEETARFVKMYLSDIQNQMLICGFCDADVNNLPMWAYYANNHQGYFVRYKVINKKAIREVVYTSERTDVLKIIINFFNSLIETVKQKKETKRFLIFGEVVTLLFCIKHSSWKSEKEYRVFYAGDGVNGTRISNDRIGLIPESVYVGVKCSENHKKIITSICHDNLKCKVYQCHIGKGKEFITYEEI